MAKRTLVIGDKNLSSWSLRPWIALKQAGVPFDEELVRLYQPDTAARIARHSPTGRVPVLVDGELTVWESLAICEYAAELAPEAKLWPADRAVRAEARSAATEMHGGFAELRKLMAMNIVKRLPRPASTPQLDADIARIVALWERCRARHGRGGPFLFGHFTVADAMYAPVTTRFTTYGVALSAASQAYVEAMRDLPAMKEWAAAAALEPAK